MWMKNRLDVHPTFFFYSEDIPIKIPSSLKSLKKLQKTEFFVHKKCFFKYENLAEKLCV